MIDRAVVDRVVIDKIAGASSPNRILDSSDARLSNIQLRKLSDVQLQSSHLEASLRCQTL